MGLQFVFGGSGSGKSTLVFQKVIEQSQQDMAKHFFLMVPDQFTMYTQKEICEMHPRGGIMNIDVLSFSRLIHRMIRGKTLCSVRWQRMWKKSLYCFKRS